MNYEETQYALAKQLNTAHTLSTDYGDLPLDAAMQQAIDQALRPILERRLDPPDAADIGATKAKALDIANVACFLEALYETDYIEALNAAEGVEAIAKALDYEGLGAALSTIARTLSQDAEHRQKAAKRHVAVLDQLCDEQSRLLPARTVARSEAVS